jgi:hypothetical protein
MLAISLMVLKLKSDDVQECSSSMINQIANFTILVTFD